MNVTAVVMPVLAVMASGGMESVEPCVSLSIDSVVLSDPLNGSERPHPIPGAILGVTVTAVSECAEETADGSLVVVVAVPDACLLRTGEEGAGVFLETRGAGVAIRKEAVPAEDLSYSCNGGRTFDCKPGVGRGSEVVSHIRIRPKQSLRGRTESGPGRMVWSYELIIQ